MRGFDRDTTHHIRCHFVTPGPRRPGPRRPIAPIHRGPQAMPQQQQQHVGTAHSFTTRRTPHSSSTSTTSRWESAPTSQTELANLLASDIIKGKVAVQRAYADWRRYPQYIVPLAESSIDMIMAPAYGSSKKNATDIRLAIDAIELVFTRPEIGTFILLSGDSDFSSLVIKLKEYGKYVIGVGIRESSSDLLVHELRRVLQLQRARRPREDERRRSRRSAIRGSSSPKPCSA